MTKEARGQENPPRLSDPASETPISIIARCDLGQGEKTLLVKDCIDIAGMPTRLCSRIFEDAAPAAEHAEVVANLLAKGSWRIVGKANMHELAFGVTGFNAWTGTPENPHWPGRIPGGSSSGSASAVAAGLVDAALGTDTGGSVRMPAACCGVIGLKPTYGLVSRKGVTPARSSLDCVGLFANRMDILEDAFAAILPGYAPAPTPAAVRVALAKVAADPDVLAAVDAMVRASGAEIDAVDLPLLETAFDAGVAIIGSENWAALQGVIDHPAMGEDVRSRLLAASRLTPGDIAAAETVRRDFAAQVDALLEDHDVVALPTLPSVPPTLEEAADPRTCVPLTRFVRPFNLSGHPAITLPCRTADGLPAGLQLVGRRGEDARLCAVARWFAGR